MVLSFSCWLCWLACVWVCFVVCDYSVCYFGGAVLDLLCLVCFACLRAVCVWLCVLGWLRWYCVWVWLVGL